MSLKRSSTCSTYTWIEEWSVGQQERMWGGVVKDALIERLRPVGVNG